MLPRTTIITIEDGRGRERLTLDQCKLRVHSLAQAIRTAREDVLSRHVRLGSLLLLIKAGLADSHGEWGVWLSQAPVHQKTAGRCIRFAMKFAGRDGGLDIDRLFELVHRAMPGEFPSRETFEPGQVSQRQVERLLREDSAAERRVQVPAPRHQSEGSWTRASKMTGSGGEKWRGNGLDLPRARVGDISGQGMLDIFTPMLDEVRDICRLADTLDHSGRRELRELNERHRCELRSFRDRHTREGVVG